MPQTPAGQASPRKSLKLQHFRRPPVCATRFRGGGARVKSELKYLSARYTPAEKGTALSD